MHFGLSWYQENSAAHLLPIQKPQKTLTFEKPQTSLVLMLKEAMFQS